MKALGTARDVYEYVVRLKITLISYGDFSVLASGRTVKLGRPCCVQYQAPYFH